MKKDLVMEFFNNNSLINVEISKLSVLFLGALLEGEQGERSLPQVFGTYLIGFQKKFL